MTDIYLQRPSRYIEDWLIDSIQPVQANDKLRLVVQTTSDFKKSGIYSAQRDDTSKPVVIDWGDGIVENVNGDVSQKVHTYASVGTFNVVVENIKSYAASDGNNTWTNTTSQNKITLQEVVAMPDSMSGIDSYSFYGCYNLMNVNINSNVLSIGSYAFHSCQSINDINIPVNLSAIQPGTFYDCVNMTEISVGNVSIDFYDVFGGLTPLEIMVFPNNTVAEIQASYQNVYYWFGMNVRTITMVGTDGEYEQTVECFVKGTKILMADGTSKNVEDINYGDSLKVWDFDNGCLSSAPVCWLTQAGLKNNHYYQLTFSDGTVLKTTGQNSNHKLYDVDKCKFEGVKNIQVGDRIYSINGIVTVTDKQYVEAEVQYYNLMTTGKINCFAEGILASNRYSNIYGIDSSMTYIKEDRQARPYSEFEEVGIDRYFYDNLRLGEIDPAQEPMSKTIQYINKIKSVMRQLPENN